MKFFIYDNVNEQVVINREGILLVKEFAILMNEQRNKCTADPLGKNKIRAYKEFAYIFLFFDWESPFFNEPEQDRHQRSLENSGLTDEEFEDPEFKSACRMYESIQNGGINIRMLRACMSAVEKLIFYFETVDINERDAVTGKPIFSSKDLISNIKNAKELVASLNELETQVKKELEPDSGLRGGTEAGFFDQGQIRF
jgi:hypothetical protein